MKMKSCLKLLSVVTISAVSLPVLAVVADVSSATTSSGSTIALTAIATNNIRSRQQQQRRLDDPWDVGTKVYNEFPSDGWWSGTITSYNAQAGMYTITWEDGSTDYFDDDDKINQMVAYARNDPQNNPAGASNTPDNSGIYPTETPLSMFEDGIWYNGVVVNYGNSSGTGIYSVQWGAGGRGEVEQIQAGAVMDQMVTDFNKDHSVPPAGYETPAALPGNDTSTSTTSNTITSSVPVQVGTPVSYFKEGRWIDGTITGYFDSVYTVMWQDSTVDKYDDFGTDLKELEQAISDAYGDDDSAPTGTGNPIPTAPGSPPSNDSIQLTIGTIVSDYENGFWVDGVVVGFQTGNYVVRWDDEDQLEYYASSNAENMQELTKMANYALADDDGPPGGFVDAQKLWENGTRVAYDENGVWYLGTISGFSKNEYKITWDDNEIEIVKDLDLVNEMVANGGANDPTGSSKGQKYDIGQLVYTEFDQGWYVGRIVMYNDNTGFYTVRWPDGDHDLYKPNDLKSMVKAARYIPDNEDAIIDGPNHTGMSSAGKVLLSLFGIAVGIVGSIFAYKIYQKRQIQLKRERELVLEDDPSNMYRDEPSELPKII